MDDVDDDDSNDENDGAWWVFLFQALKACAEPAAQNLQRAIQRRGRVIELSRRDKTL